MQDSQLLQQYENIKTEDDLLSLIRDGVREGLRIEYKQKANPRCPELDDPDRKNFSRTLSSFANSEGGILIWGIKTNKKGDVKLPKKLVAIKQIFEFEKRLNNFLANAIQPSIEGLRSEIVYKKGSKSFGYVKYYIPQSEMTPHRSVSDEAKFDHYYARNSDGSYRMPHYQLSDMFGRRQKPVLDMKFQSNDKKRLLKKEMTQVDGYYSKYTMTLYISNTGRAIGRDSMAIILGPKASKMKITFNPINISVNRIDDMYDDRQTFQLVIRNEIFYPRSETRIGNMIVQLYKDAVPEDAKLVWRIYSDNMVARSGEIRLLNEGEVGI